MDLTIDRLHARYLLERPGSTEQLDACLRRLVAEELDRAWLDTTRPASDHVCVPGFTVPVSLDPATGVVAAARSWARAIITMLERMIRDGTGVVVYPRTLDALVDLVVSAGRGNTQRAWAWRQAGLVPAATTTRISSAALVPAALVAHALVTHAELAPAALVAAAARGRVPLSAGGWVAVARAVHDHAVGPVTRWRAEPIDADGNPAAHERPLDGSGPACPGNHPEAGSALATAVRITVDSPVGRQLPVADLAPEDRRAIARLALLCCVPSLARTEPVVDAVTITLATRAKPEPPAAGAPEELPAPRSSPDQPPVARTDEAITTVLAHPGGAAPDPLDPAGTSAKPDPVCAGAPLAITSELGGVLFLIRVIDDLEIEERPDAPLGERPLPWIVSSLATRLSAAPPEDPAVRTLIGPLHDTVLDLLTSPPATAEDAALTTLADRVSAWLRLHLRLDPADELDWLWHRPVTIVAEPGWIEAAFKLEDVDTRIRLAGLDLDPGFVWWLGAVVRYRYV